MLVRLCILASLAFNALCILVSNSFNLELECIACQANSVCKKIICESQLENDDNKSKKNLQCFTATSPDSIIKHCTYENSNICERLKNDKYDSCTTCNTSYCNTMKCYRCNNFFHELSLGMPEICDESSVDFCRFPDPQCFSARALIRGDTITIKGCVPRNYVKSFGNTLKSFGFSHYFCDKSLCNGRSPRALLFPDSDALERSSNVSVPKGDVDKEGSFSCLICKPESQESCYLESCQKVLHDKSPQRYKCLAATTSQEGKSKSFKTCLREDSNHCAVLKKQGYESCETCPTSKCNVLSCYYCNDSDNFYNRLSLKPCKVLVEKECSVEPAKCYSVAATLNGNSSTYKTCIHEGSNRCDELRKKGFDCRTCDTNACNALTCYFCKDEYNDIPFLLGECKDLTKFKCNLNEPSECFSVTATLTGPGSFLVRPSDNSPGDYSLFFHINNQIQRFRIEKKGVRYLMGGRIFECLDAVINRYRKEQIVEGYTLQHPLVVDGSKQVDWVPDNPKVKSEAEKIYATLRECRDQAGLKKMRGIKHQGFLHRKSDKAAKKWKLLYFALVVDGTDTHLYLYENPKRTKPKGLIDLSCAYLYQVHDSLWERPHCLQIVERALPCLATVTHLAAPSTEECQGWVNALKPLCVPQLSRATCKVPRLRELRCLTLHILDAHRLPFKLVPQPYVTTQFNNQVRIARTRAKSGPDPVWDEEFVFDDVPCDVVSFTLTVHNKGKRGKDTEVAELHVELSSLGNGEEREEWYTLSGLTPMGEWGSLRLRTRYLHDLVMPAEEYSPLQQLLLQAGLASVKTLAEICHADRAPLATALLRVFRAEGRETELLIELNSAEIERETETSTLFRAASLSTTLMDLFMRAECRGFLQAAVLETVLRLLDSKQSAELNPAKMDSLDDACNNAEFLLQVLDQVALSIFMSSDACPKSVRYICGCLQKAVGAKWPDERPVRARVVSGFIFLRLLCPALLNPRQFGLVSEQPSPSATRSLVMVAKCLQNLANLVEFGGKEPYMEVVNPFILKNKERMIVFLDHLSNVPDPGEPRITSKPDTAKELATLHHICVAHLTELQAVAKVNSNIKTLVTVTEMLATHKQKYLEMIR